MHSSIFRHPRDPPRLTSGIDYISHTRARQRSPRDPTPSAVNIHTKLLPKNPSAFWACVLCVRLPCLGLGWLCPVSPCISAATFRRPLPLRPPRARSRVALPYRALCPALRAQVLERSSSLLAFDRSLGTARGCEVGRDDQVHGAMLVPRADASGSHRAPLPGVPITSLTHRPRLACLPFLRST